MQKVSTEQAIAEVNSWLDYKKVKTAKRESNAEHIDTLVSCVEDGTIIINDDKTIVHELGFALENTEGETTVERLTYKARLTMLDIQRATKGISPNDQTERMFGFGNALTNVGRGVLKKLDSVDNGVLQAIAIFFT